MFFRQLSQLFSTSDQKKIFKNFPDLLKKKNRILAILDKYGTPVFIIDRETVLARFDRLSRALSSTWGNNFKIAYSFKTNYEIAKAKILKKQGAWAEVVSGNEYILAKKLGYKGGETIFNGPLKTDADLNRALADRALIQLDNLSELLRLSSLGKGSLRKARLGLRLSVSVPYLSRSRFGFSLENGRAGEALEILKNHGLHLTSLHFHIGTDVDKVDSYRSAAQELARFCIVVEKVLGRQVSILDMGGGFPSSGLPPFGKDSWDPRPIEDYLEAISTTLKTSLINFKQKTLIFEPGRFLSDDAGVLITKVYDVDMNEEIQKVLTDAAVTILPLKYYRPQIVKVFTPKMNERRDKSGQTLIYGATCREDDLITGGVYPVTEVDDYIIYYCVGAYNHSLGSDFIFGKLGTFII